MAHGLIRGYIRSDHKAINMKAFYSALVQAPRKARLSSEHQNRTQAPSPDVAYWHRADIDFGALDVCLGVQRGRGLAELGQPLLTRSGRRDVH